MKKLSLFLAITMLFPTFMYAQNEIRRMDSLISNYVDQSDFTGSILIAKEGKILLAKAYGYSDADNKMPNTPSTVYNIASLTKTFTAALVLKLQEMKKLSTADKLDQYYPAYPNGGRITIHHLLTHTSGIPDYLNDKSFSQVDQTKETGLEQMIGRFKDRPLDFEPGTKFRYSNSGYTLLGYIIEKVTGMTYGRALEHYIFRPLRMQHTSFGPASQDKHLANGYMVYYKNFKMPSFSVHPSLSYATGAIYSTVEDLYKWNQALLSDKFLSKASIDAAYHKDKGPYGYGWFADSLYGKLRVSHDGNIPGFKANINRMPDDKVCVIALSNANNSSVGRLVRDIINILYNQPLSKPFTDLPVISMPDSVKRIFTGTYTFKNKDSIRIAVQLKEAKLTVKLPNQPEFEIAPVGRNQFRNGNTRVEFMVTNEGKPTQIIIYSKGEILGAGKDE
jgi:CubicO group peptidase (beta-lactamase class C family)